MYAFRGSLIVGVFVLLASVASAAVEVTAKGEEVTVIGQTDKNIDVTGSYTGIDPDKVDKVSATFQEVDANGSKIGDPKTFSVDKLVAKDFKISYLNVPGGKKKFKVTVKVFDKGPPPVEATSKEIEVSTGG